MTPGKRSDHFMKNRVVKKIAVILAVLSGAVFGPSSNSQAELTRKHHHWGRFEKGAWSQMKETVANFDDDGELASVSVREIVTTILDVTPDLVTLKIETTMDVAGRPVNVPPKVQTYPYKITSGDEGKVIVIEEKEGSAKVESRSIPCQISIYNVETPRGISHVIETQSTKVHPYVLSRETVFKDTDDVQIAKSSVKVISIKMPIRVVDEIKDCASVLKIEETTHGKRVVSEEICLDIPGGIVRSSEKSISPSGDLKAHKTKELMDYGIETRIQTVSPRRPLLKRSRDR